MKKGYLLHGHNLNNELTQYFDGPMPSDTWMISYSIVEMNTRLQVCNSDSFIIIAIHITDKVSDMNTLVDSL